MIINVGARTDIVNYYTPWLMNRLDEGFAYSRNPYVPKQVLKYDLSNDVVDCIVFCSKNYEPILDSMSSVMADYNTFCYYTITSYGCDVEGNVASIDDSIDTLMELAHIVGKKRLCWRFDPILLTNKYSVDYHISMFDYIASAISDYVSFAVFSFVDMYDKLSYNMPEIIDLSAEDKDRIAENLGNIAAKYGLKLQSCACEDNYHRYGIRGGGCLTPRILSRANDVDFKKTSLKGFRKGCECMNYSDIGEYNTCINGCKYCYANKNKRVARRNYRLHDENSPILIGHINEDDVIVEAKQKSILKNDRFQTKLF